MSAEAPPVQHRSVRERVVSELVRFVVIFLYLWLLFGLFVVCERIILVQRGVGFASQGFAIINALVFAKVVLIAEDLKFGGWFRDRPRILTIIVDTLLFSMLFLVVHVAEEVLIGVLHGKAAEASVPEMGGGGVAGVACVAVILFCALLPYFMFVHIGRALEPGWLNAVLFRPPQRTLAEG